MKKITKYLFIFLIMLFVVPVFAETGVSVGKISGSSQSEGVILNATDKIDIEFNELKQNAVYNLILKNDTDKTVYVHDVVAENLSEEFIDFSLSEKSVDTKIEPGKEGKIDVLVKTLDITHAGRNVDDEITLKILLGNSVLNPETSGNLITVLLIVAVVVSMLFVLNRNTNKLKKISVLVVGGLLVSVTVVYASDSNYVDIDGKVKYVSQNLLQGSGVTLNGSVTDYSGATKIWKEASSIKKITISDEKSEIKDFEKKFDLTSDSSERVVAYFVDNGDDEVPYDLHIKADGVIYAPADSTGLFAFPNVESIEGLEFVEFDETTKMTAMFKDNKKLKDVDVSAIDMSNATDTSYMFNGCDELEVSEEDFDLEHIPVKDKMFNEKLINVVSGSLDEPGSIVSLGNEQFYVIGQENGNVKLLSMYNLHVGNRVDENLNVSSLLNPTGIQDESAKGFNLDGLSDTRIYPFIGTTAFSEEDSTYAGSIVEEYVNNYKTYLAGLGANIAKARLITIDELEALGCSSDDRDCSNAPEWVYSTSYWTGSAYTNARVWNVYNYAGLHVYGCYSDSDNGVRPVIEISVSEF